MRPLPRRAIVRSGRPGVKVVRPRGAAPWPRAARPRDRQL